MTDVNNYEQQIIDYIYSTYNFIENVKLCKSRATLKKKGRMRIEGLQTEL